MLEAHYVTKTIRGWPRLVFEVFRQDRYGRNEVCKLLSSHEKDGYGTVALPSLPGTHRLECGIWRPKARWVEELAGELLGTRLALERVQSVAEEGERQHLSTESLGKVFLTVALITRENAGQGTNGPSAAVPQLSK
jgi:B9 domain-containing protein 2